MSCVLKKVLKCECSQVSAQITVLIDSINKLCEATDNLDKLIYDTESVDSIPDALQQCNRTIKLIAKSSDRLRLESIANKEATYELETNLKNTIKEYENQLSSCRTSLNNSNQCYINAMEDYTDLCKSLINFRDQLSIFKDNFEKSEDINSAKLIDNLYVHLGHLMIENNMDILNEKGIFSREVHMVVGSIKTSNKELHNTIESTFRDGYKINGDLYRPQEVIIYVYEEDKENSHDNRY